MRPVRRLVRTEIVLPRTRSGKYAVLAALAIGGSVAVAMVVLFTAYLVETVRNIQ